MSAHHFSGVDVVEVFPLLTSTETVGLLGTGAQDVHLGFHFLSAADGVNVYKLLLRHNKASLFDLPELCCFSFGSVCHSDLIGNLSVTPMGVIKEE